MGWMDTAIPRCLILTHHCWGKSGARLQITQPHWCNPKAGGGYFSPESNSSSLRKQWLTQPERLTEDTVLVLRVLLEWWCPSPGKVHESAQASTMVHTCNASTQESEAGGSQVWVAVYLVSLFKKKKIRQWWLSICLYFNSSLLTAME